MKNIYYHLPRIFKVSESFYKRGSDTMRVLWLLFIELFFDPIEFRLETYFDRSNLEFASNKFLPLPFLRLLLSPFSKSKKLISPSYILFYFFIFIFAICFAGVLPLLIIETLFSLGFGMYFRFWYKDYC